MNTPRGHFTNLLAIAGLVLPASAGGAPNILIILADDMGTEVLSSCGLGNPTAVTPTLDRLAEEGVRFERYKLLVMNEREEFYDVEADSNELRPLSLQSLSAEARSSCDRPRGLVDNVISE